VSGRSRAHKRAQPPSASSIRASSCHEGIQPTRAHPRSPRAGAFEATVHTKQGNLLALHLDKFGLVVCQLVGRGHLNELGQRSLLSAGGSRAAGVFFAEDCGEPGASVCARTPLTSRIRTGRSRTDGRTRRRDGERGDGGRGGGRARGPCPGPRHRRAGGGAGTRSGERGATGSAKSCAIPPQGHV